MIRPALLAVAVALAPMQCQSEDPATRRYESPGDALYNLAQEFRAKGKDDAYKETLRFIIERYPSSRRAVTAKLELEKLAVPVPTGSASQ